MAVRGIHEVVPELLIRDGILGRHKPSKQDLLDIKRAVPVASELGRLDVGQAVIVQEGLVLAVEGGILLKLRKPQQDMRIDLPTIGSRTIERAKEAGLNGVVLHAGNGLIVDEAEVIKTADKLGLFVMGINPGEYL